ncbi:SPOR domain-containing protein [Agriterribacter sp.]|uniref:SPOR domain-containing protein n=1 Tax=Agriterribacter sp. TaxID=2821509 RepID=UPI002D140654|nr:SPOR domain-containing protein [Agriterribacter sp.]HRP56155.1 SPOR domain-containing protein [Agriterribacter sp.]
MKRICICAIAFFIASGAFAQDPENDSLQHVSVNSDPRVNALVKKNREVNEVAYLTTIKNMSGFRLQVINTNDRKKALSVKTRMLSDFPEEKTYFIYHSPYFKIQMGNFRTREDAEELMEKVKKIYPSGVFIVPAKIQMKPSKDGELILDVVSDRP